MCFRYSFKDDPICNSPFGVCQGQTLLMLQTSGQCFSWSFLYFKLFCYIREKAAVELNSTQTVGFSLPTTGLAEQITEYPPLFSRCHVKNVSHIWFDFLKCNWKDFILFHWQVWQTPLNVWTNQITNKIEMTEMYKTDLQHFTQVLRTIWQALQNRCLITLCCFQLLLQIVSKDKTAWKIKWKSCAHISPAKT